MKIRQFSHGQHGRGRYFEKYQIWGPNDIMIRLLCRFYVGLKPNILYIWMQWKFDNFPTINMGVVDTSKNIQFEASMTSGIDFSVDFTLVLSLMMCISDKNKNSKIFPR